MNTLHLFEETVIWAGYLSLMYNKVEEMLKHFTQIARKKKTIVCYKLIVALYCVWEAKITIKNP